MDFSLGVGSQTALTRQGRWYWKCQRYEIYPYEGG